MSGTLLLMIICIIVLLLWIRMCFKYPAPKSTRRVRGLVTAALLIVIVLCAVREFGPRGNNSIFAKPGVGENQGTDDKQTYGQGQSGTAIEGDFVIVVKGKTVVVADREYTVDENGEELAEYLRRSNLKNKDVVLVDDYAMSDTYHYVEHLLEENGARIQNR